MSHGGEDLFGEIGGLYTQAGRIYARVAAEVFAFDLVVLLDLGGLVEVLDPVRVDHRRQRVGQGGLPHLAGGAYADDAMPERAQLTQQAALLQTPHLPCPEHPNRRSGA